MLINAKSESLHPVSQLQRPGGLNETQTALKPSHDPWDMCNRQKAFDCDDSSPPSMHQSPLEILLKCRFRSVSVGWGLGLCLSNKLPRDADEADPRLILQTVVTQCRRLTQERGCDWVSWPEAGGLGEGFPRGFTFNLGADHQHP